MELSLTEEEKKANALVEKKMEEYAETAKGGEKVLEQMRKFGGWVQLRGTEEEKKTFAKKREAVWSITEEARKKRSESYRQHLLAEMRPLMRIADEFVEDAKAKMGLQEPKAEKDGE
jgi:hypothetical protein